MRLSMAGAGVAVVLSVIAAAWVGTFDAYNHVGCTVDASGARACAVFSTDVIEENGTWVWGLLILPALFCAAVIVALKQRTPPAHRLAMVLAGLFLTGSIVSGFSIGLPFLPAALLLFGAVVLDRPAVNVRV